MPPFTDHRGIQIIHILGLLLNYSVLFIQYFWSILDSFLHIFSSNSIYRQLFGVYFYDHSIVQVHVTSYYLDSLLTTLCICYVHMCLLVLLQAKLDSNRRYTGPG